jgi:hypothetical protein
MVCQENGTIAEARTRAFLVDRFWVLERSADVEGADFIIQRRITQTSLLDKTPPRLGFIQVKFFASEATTQYVHREYVVDADGEPRSEFFVMSQTGTEDAPQSFLLSAQQIYDHFRCTDEKHSKPMQYALPGKSVLKSEFEISDRRQALDTIESALRNADFAKNRRFVGWAMPSISKEPPPILPMYNEEIDNWWGNIPNSVAGIQKAAWYLSYEFEEALDDFKKICESQDPEEVLELSEKLYENWGRSVSGLKKLYDEDLHTVVRLHKKRHEQMSKAGLLNRHAGIRRKIKARFIKDVVPEMPAAKSLVYVLEVAYNKDTWEDVALSHRFSTPEQLWPDGAIDHFDRKADMPDAHGVLKAKPGKIAVYLAPGRFGFGGFKNGKYVEDNDSPWPAKLEPISNQLAGTVMEKLLTERFGEWDQQEGN